MQIILIDVNGGWSHWYWSPCSATCGKGIITRTRTCTHPSPGDNGAYCVGPSLQTYECSGQHCPVHGTWGSWSHYSQCSVTCGGGTQIRTRTCTHRHVHGEVSCLGLANETRKCSEQHCPDFHTVVNGGWSHWSRYGHCSVTCGIGVKSRNRTCSNPTPAKGGATCVGHSFETQRCRYQYCEVDGGWNRWSAFGHCSVTCGTGNKTRTRTCSHPFPAHGGANCQGVNSEVQSCTEQPCPVDGGWSRWSTLSDCSVTCGPGHKTRTRACSHPFPAHGGANCLGVNSEVQNCTEKLCPVNGSWSVWSAFSQCSRTCGYGLKTRRRTCSNPAPAHGGAYCPGLRVDSSICSEQLCPVNGGWSKWSSFSNCSTSCGRGTMTRTRTCSNPSPAHNGADCVGHSIESHACNDHLCPVDGEWSSWSTFSQCTASCGGGTQVRTRTCTHPRPLHGGATCTGFANETQKCSENSCPVNGGWSKWSSFSNCSTSCGRGTMTRTRTCSNPSPAHNGADCVGHSTESHACNDHLCPVDGGWSSWNTFSQCTLSCGGGTQIRTRTCTHPRPLHGGANCKGSANETQKCSENGCPVNGQWSTWGQYSACTKTCGNGSKTRQRLCSSPAPLNGGNPCYGNNSETDQCNNILCPVDGGWSTWTDYRSCSVTCGVGIQKRERTCTEPTPAHGGTDCVGQSTEVQNCTKIDCPVNGHWSEWSLFSECSKTCGKGSQRRQRTCTNPAPSNGGLVCVGDGHETVDCEIKACPVDGSWTAWTSFGACSVTCGTGIKTKTRTCTNPVPTNGGNTCSGHDEQAEICHEKHCAVDGNWSGWGSYSLCDVTCGTGWKLRRRNCTNPPPSGGGGDCVGLNEEGILCFNKPCPIDGAWSMWSSYSTCSVSCGGGNKQRNRTCNSPVPSNGGQDYSFG
ncbi:SCO-spondin-like [Saccostrea echinata]|uniref:SCO-spondin-like n=1 Tax=Saccostrea echinata TaxID=191078 RepID=UPI002A83559C|nr:SCO-spondin-like [Saccostrea echinata]